MKATEKVIQIIPAPKKIFAATQPPYYPDDGPPDPIQLEANILPCPVVAVIEESDEDATYSVVIPLAFDESEGFVRVDNENGFLGFTSDPSPEPFNEQIKRNIAYAIKRHAKKEAVKSIAPQ